ANLTASRRCRPPPCPSPTRGEGTGGQASLQSASKPHEDPTALEVVQNSPEQRVSSRQHNTPTMAARRVRVVPSPLVGEGQGGGCPATADSGSDDRFAHASRNTITVPHSARNTSMRDQKEAGYADRDGSPERFYEAPGFGYCSTIRVSFWTDENCSLN